MASPAQNAPQEHATARLAEQIAALTYDDLPDHVRTAAHLCVLDVLGVTIAGATEPVTDIVATTLAANAGATGMATAAGIVTGTATGTGTGTEAGTDAGTGTEAATGAEGPRGIATLLGRTGTASPLDAALVNGTAAHALDFDDVAAAMNGHPSAPVLPAALALAEARGLSGADLITAFVAGFETECRVGSALTGHYERGFHTTATVGTLGAAAASARLLNLDAEATTRALGIAATQAAGLKAMFGTMCKPLHAGKAASSGLLAALLAEQGMTSAEEPLTAHQGLAETQAEAFDATAITKFGDPWHVPQALFKMHASCYLTHAPINALLNLRRAHADLAEETDTIELRVHPGHLHVCAIPEPRTALEGKFSLRFTAALALAEGTADESRFTPAKVNDPHLTALRDRVTVIPDESVRKWEGHVTLTTHDGTTYRANADTGTPAWTTDPAEQTPALAAKFHSLTAPRLGEERAKRLSETTLNLAKLHNLNNLNDLTTPTTPQA